ncbi:MAG: DinB family protein [Ignavibacteriaceae bacterium]
MITKENLLKLFRKEFATTLKVMRAFPEDKLDFAPHERSQTAKRTMSTFIFEMFFMESYVFGGKLDRAAFQNYAPGDLQTLIADFEKHTSNVISKLGNLPDEEMKKIVEFAGAKIPVDEFMLMMLLDQIHHRGQMSVYIRLAGGKVPSIYGPSADDPLPNL